MSAEAQRKWRSVPENAEKAREATRRWRAAHRDEANAKARRARREAWQRVADLKVARGCVDCGYDEHPEALDFDHVRGEKKFNIGQQCSRAWDVVLAEIEKCDVVCANCHRIRTRKRIHAAQ